MLCCPIAAVRHTADVDREARGGDLSHRGGGAGRDDRDRDARDGEGSPDDPRQRQRLPGEPRPLSRHGLSLRLPAVAPSEQLRLEEIAPHVWRLHQESLHVPGAVISHALRGQ